MTEGVFEFVDEADRTMFMLRWAWCLTNLAHGIGNSTIFGYPDVSTANGAGENMFVGAGVLDPVGDFGVMVMSLKY